MAISTFSHVGVGDVAGHSQFIRKGETALALLCFRSPTADGVPPHRRNQLGITHLGFVVDDIDGTRRVSHAAISG
ncbi:MAG TPA: hypothetical protein VM282_13100 [Acidimicrobiales bacterium]|nr:hypothetical protein [Acidimicrobiales bacterium]